MKRFMFFVGLVCTLGCSKKEISNTENTSYYQSEGNLLILQVGSVFEGAYEYQLNTISLLNDSLQVEINSITNSLEPISYWKLLPNEDTLFWSTAYEVNFGTPMIGKEALQHSLSSVSLNPLMIQLISTGSTDYAQLWSEINNLSIVLDYRLSQPNSKIGLTRIVTQELSEEYGLMVPVEKHLFFMVR